MTHIIHRPKHVAGIAITIAIIVGTIGAIVITRPPTYQFAKVGPGTIETAWDAATGTTAGNLTLSFQASGQITGVFVKVGDTVKTGEVLATLDPQNTAGSLTQAKAAYATAEANYEKLQNGATEADIAVTTATLAAAQTTLAHNEQTLLQTLDDSLTVATNAVRNETDAFFTNPESDTPTLTTTGINFSDQDLQYQVQHERSSINAMLLSWKQALAGIAAGSDLTAPENDAQNNLQSVAAYLKDLNTLFTSYASGNAAAVGAAQANILSAQGSVTGQISALNGAVQAVASAQAGVVQSQAALTLKTSGARPEDIAAAQAQVNSALGAMQIAQSAYNNRIITAPGDGTITAVYVSAGETAAPNAPAIDLSATTVSKNVALMVPTSAIIDREGTLYVVAKTKNGTEERQIAAGASDATNTEILSGLSAGDEVVIH